MCYNNVAMNSSLHYVCDSCGKGVQHSNLVSHAKNRTHTIRKPNLHSAKLMIDGQRLRVRMCTKCLRTVKAALKETPKAEK